MCISCGQQQKQVNHLGAVKGLNSPSLYLLRSEQVKKNNKTKMPCPCGSGCKCASQTTKGSCNCGSDCKCGGEKKSACACSK
ncbi:cadmium-metallothionein [Drosophila elegans]|uniref:cadmium-metallothionein n=1 Tax=Drosophila elegans TaxID=30023 RepID=UPI0007E7700C|nr:cadmium-metallothionein [Drosophila elegans]